MAELKIKISIREDGEVITVSDEGSVWGTPNRADIMLMLYAKYNATAGVEVITDQNVFSYNPDFDNTVVTTFEVPYTLDGWHTFHLIIIPITASDNEGNIRFNTGTSKLEIFEGGVWIELLSDRWDLLLTEDYERVTQESMLYSKLAIRTNCLWNNIVAKKCADMKCASDKFWFMRGQLYALLNQFYMGHGQDAQLMMENTTTHAELI